MTSLRLQSLWIIGCASVLLAACAPEPPPPLPTPAPALPPTQVFPSPEPSPTATVEAALPEAMEVVVAADLNYAGESLMDVYSPSDAGQWPVVLLLHGGGLNKTAVSGLARAIAGQGLVVFVPTYASSEPSPKAITLGAEEAACAARYARAKAIDYGGMAGSVTAVRHSSGGAFGHATRPGGRRVRRRLRGHGRQRPR